MWALAEANRTKGMDPELTAQKKLGDVFIRRVYMPDRFEERER